MKIKKYIKWVPVFGALCSIGFAQEKLPVVAISQIVEHEALNETRKGIIDELKASGFEEGKTMKLVFDTAQGDGIVANQIAVRFRSLEPAVVVGIGTQMAQSLKQVFNGTDVPVVFASVTDPLGSKLVTDIEPTKTPVVGCSNWVELGPQLKKFKQIVPGMKRLGVVYNPSEANSEVMVRLLVAEGKRAGIEVVRGVAMNSSEVVTAARSLVGQVDAMFVSNDNTALSAFEGVVKVASGAGLPVFVSDTDMVKRGAVAALGPNQYELGRQTGRMIVELLKGEKRVEEFAVGYPQKTEFYVNERAMAGIRLAVPDSIFEEADCVI